jgi:hypothetical protein
VLTQPEYQQLNSLFIRLHAQKGTNLHALRDRLSLCRRGPSASSLVRDVRADCAALVEVQIAGIKIATVEKRCGTYTSVAEALNCLIPDYRTFYRGLEGLYHDLVRIEHLDKARGLRAGCVVIVGGDPKGVAIYGRIAHDAGEVLSYLHSKNTVRLRDAEDRLFAAENSSSATARGALSDCAAL